MFLERFCLLILLQYVLSSQLPEDEQLFNKVHTALHKVLDFIYENRNTINVDGFFGVTIAQAQLQVALHEYHKEEHKYLLRVTKEKTNKILNSINVAEMDLNTNYKLFSEYLLNPKIWENNVTFSTGKLSNDIIENIKKLSCDEYETALATIQFSEGLSDYCIAEMIKDKTKRKFCTINDQCNKYLVESNDEAIGYLISHRLLYLQISKALQCNWNSTWLNEKIQSYCTFMYLEAQVDVECSDIDAMVDIFLEQVLLCGIEGFEEFLQRSWIQHVLTMQTENGCYGYPFLRTKREANNIKFGCVDHTTGLAAGVLSLFLRFLVN